MKRAVIWLGVILLYAGVARAQLRMPEFVTAPQAGLTSRDLDQLRPVLLPDLQKAMRQSDFTTATRADAEQALKDCRFARLDLAPLGTAIAVEWNEFPDTPNANLVNVYVRQAGKFRRIAEASGFGPYVLKRSGHFPDLVFGGTGGVCAETYNRFRFAHGQYTPDACVAKQRDGERCLSVSCSNGLPLFPDPFGDPDFTR